jgi:glutathione-independent formaldehyde dehydrogenase
VIVGDPNAARREHARGFGCATVDPLAGSLPEQLEQIVGVPAVDAAGGLCRVRGKGPRGGDRAERGCAQPGHGATRAAGGIGIPGLYVTEDPGAADESARHGTLSLRFGLGWAKSLTFATGQTPTMRYNRQLREAILNDRVHIARNVNATVPPLEEAPRGYEEFDAGPPKKFVLDPHGMLGAA